MQQVLKGVTIIDPTSPYHQQQKDIRIQDGLITEISDELANSDEEEVNDFTGNYISPGWFDLLASFGDPGHEQKEDIASGIKAAAAGGFTSLGLMPNTQPALHSKSEIEYIINKSAGQIVKIIPYGAITKNREGKELTEMYDMRNAGAAAFTDADLAIADAGIMLRSLLYVKPFNGVIINIPNDHKIIGNAAVNEGLMSTQLGMYGMPDVLEELMVIRDIKLAEYTNSKVHIGMISSAKSIPHIRNAKQRGVQVTASVSAYQIYFDENELHDYNTNFKVNPPLRTRKDIDALIEGLKDGTIDVISSNHLPHETDAKDLEFEYAAYGMESLEATFGAANKILKDTLSTEQLIEKISLNPRKILGLEIPTIKENAKAELTIFDTDSNYIFSRDQIRSKSRNTGFTGRELTGRPLAILHQSQFKII